MFRYIHATALTIVAFANPGQIHAQLPTSNVSGIEPRVVRAGESVQVSLAGENLEELTELRFTHPGITAAAVMRPVDEFFPEPRMDGLKFQVTAAADVPPGIYETRAVGYFGYSKARPIVIAAADSREVAESGGNNSMDSAMPVEINSFVNGAVAARGIDWFRFSVKKGRRVMVELSAERIDSRLDGQLILYDSNGQEVARNRDTFGRDPFIEVPSEEDAEFTLAVSDILYRGGSEHFYRLRIHDGPHLDFIWPPAGEPGSTGKYTLYGRNLPKGVIDNSVRIRGRGLEAVSVDITLPDHATAPVSYFPGSVRQGVQPGFDYRINGSNAVRIGFATAPVVFDSESGDIQKIKVPSEIAGKFDTPDDEDTFRFTAKADQVYCIDAVADRISSKVDPRVIVHKVVRSEDGSETLTQVADNDDMASFFATDGKDSINADTNDAFVRFRADHDGDYQVTLLDQFGNSAANSIYRLAVRHPTPDFQLIAATERPLPTNRTGYSVTPLLRQGARWAIRIRCPRQDNFEGDIIVTAEGLPPGVTCEPLTLSGAVDQGMLVVSADINTKSWSGDIRIVGRATVDTPGGSRRLERSARFATLVWGHIFADSIRVRSRLTERIPLSTCEHEQAPVILEPVEDREWTVEVGQKLEIPVRVTNMGSRVGNLTVEPYGLWGIVRNPPTINIAEQDTEGTLVINFTKNGNFSVSPGRYMFCLQGTGVVRYRHNPAASLRAEAEQNRIRELFDRAVQASEKATSDSEQAKAALQKAKKDLSTATDGNREKSKASLDQATAAAQMAEQRAGEAQAQRRAAEKAKTEIEKAAKDAKAKAAEKNTSFAAWSRLITVRVVEPAPQK